MAIMDGNQQASRSVWGAKKSWAPSSTSTPAASSSSTAASSTSSSSSAFPPLSSSQAQRPSSRPSPHSYSSPSTSSLITPSSFNPYPTRRQELAQRAATNSTRKRSHITRSDPSASRIHSILDYDDFDDILMPDDIVAPREETSPSSSFAMSSIVFRDLSAASSVGTSRSSSPWQQGGMSAGLAMFASTSFGGEPLRVLANVDEELGAAHMGPRIYKRHNQKHVRNRVRAKIDAGHVQNTAAALTPVKAKDAMHKSDTGRTLGGSVKATTTEEREMLKGVDLQKLVDECRRCHNLSAIENRVGSGSVSTLAPEVSSPTTTLLSAVRARIADPRSWSRSKPDSIVSDDFLPSGLQQPPVDFSALPSPLLSQLRQSVLQGLTQLLQAIIESTRTDLINTLSRLLTLRPLRPTSTVLPDLRTSLQQLFLQVLDTFRQPNTASLSPVKLLSGVLHSSHPEVGDLMIDLVGELVGICGQQMSSNPAVLSETQDKTLVSASSFLSFCFDLNSTRPDSIRLPAHAFYCTVLDLAPFLEHFVHFAASLARSSSSMTTMGGLAEFNICCSPFLLSLGAKVRMLQLENEVRLSRTPARESGTPQRFELLKSDAELVVLPGSLNLKVERSAAWEQSRSLFLQLLDSDAAGVRGLRVEFAGEQAADGGGPAREWFATVATEWKDHRQVMGSHGWFTPLLDGEEKDTEDTAAFLGILLALAALHTTKLTLPFRLPSVAFKIACAPDLDQLVLTPVDLEFLDPTLAKSLQAVLDWTPAPTAETEKEKVFDSTFSLTWSTSITTADGAIQTIDLVPGGRHRSVKLSERKEFVSKLVWRVLIGSVQKQVQAFREAWQTIMPSAWLSPSALEKKGGAESATEILTRGGLALSLFSPEEVGQAILSTPTSTSSVLTTPLDIADMRGATDIITPSNIMQWSERGVVGWFWDLWTTLDALHQRRLLAFITGAEDLPATGARGIGLRIHLVPTEEKEDARSWPLPWSSTCTSTLFLPTYPTEALLGEKVRIAIEHYQGFGLR